MVEVVNRQDHGGRKQETPDQARSKFKVMYSGLEVKFRMESANTKHGGLARLPPADCDLITWTSRLERPAELSEHPDFSSIHQVYIQE